VLRSKHTHSLTTTTVVQTVEYYTNTRRALWCGHRQKRTYLYMPTERRNFKNIIDTHQVRTNDGAVEGAKKVDIGSPGPLGSSQSGWPAGIVRPKPFGRSHSKNRCVFYWWTRLFLKTYFFLYDLYCRDDFSKKSIECTGKI